MLNNISMRAVSLMHDENGISKVGSHNSKQFKWNNSQRWDIHACVANFSRLE